MLRQDCMLLSRVSHCFQSSCTGPVILLLRSGAIWRRRTKYRMCNSFLWKPRNSTKLTLIVEPLTVKPKNTYARNAALGWSRTHIMAMTCEKLLQTGSSYCRDGTYITQTLSQGRSRGHSRQGYRVSITIILCAGNLRPTSAGREVRGARFAVRQTMA